MLFYAKALFTRFKVLSMNLLSVSKDTLKLRFFSVSIYQILYKEFQACVLFFLAQSTFLLHKSKIISFCSSNLSMY